MDSVSILICSYKGSKYLERCTDSIKETTRGWNAEILFDVERKRTGLVRTPARYQKLWERTQGRIVVKSDDDILYFPGWLESCVSVLDNFPEVGYVSPLNHKILKANGHADLYTEGPIITSAKIAEPASFLAGGCWVMRKDLWEKVPYGNLSGVKTLDSNFGAAVREAGLKPVYLSHVLCSHLGVDRHGGVDL